MFFLGKETTLVYTFNNNTYVWFHSDNDAVFHLSEYPLWYFVERKDVLNT